MYFRKLGLIFLILASSHLSAGQWLYGKEIRRPEVREGHRVSVILSNTIPHEGSENLCPSNRVFFQKEKWISQEAVQQYLSLLLTTYSLKHKVSILVELDSGNCFGRIGYPEI